MREELLSALLAEGLITRHQLEKARQTQRETAAKLTEVLEHLGYLSKEILAQQISKIYDIPRITLSLDVIDPEAVKLVSPQMARKFRLIPVTHADGVLTVAMADPLDLVAIDNAKLASGLTIKPVICAENEILEALDFFFGALRKALRIRDSSRDSSIELVQSDDNDQKVEEDELEDVPTIRAFNVILSQAIEEGASDIHIEPAENLGRVRYRLDGVLHETSVLPRHLAACLVSRIKVLASLDIAERRVPQDGRFFVRYKQRDVDLRIATMPTIYGESCVIRLLDQSKSKVQLDGLGFTPDQKEVLIGSLGKPSGLVLVTGPTGSGKTTTLCAMLNYVNSFEKKIITLEDPVEYRVRIVNQVTVNPVAGLTYASALRSTLRNDPDIVLVGEIRDRESAMIAVQASLTGHLLLSTLHTNGTAETVIRLLDLGVEPFYVREVVELIVAQRLVRVLCEHCKRPCDPSPAANALLGNGNGNSEWKVFESTGCGECLGTGYKGRTAVFELLPMTEAIRDMLRPGLRAADLREQAKKEGMRTFWEAAADKILRGETTIHEASRLIPANT